MVGGDVNFGRHLRRNLAFASLRTNIQAEERLLTAQAFSCWTSHVGRHKRAAWLDRNGRVCGHGRAMSVALLRWNIQARQTRQMLAPRALLWFRVLLRTRALLVLSHWTAEVRCQAGLENLVDSFSLSWLGRVLRRWRSSSGRKLAVAAGIQTAFHHLRQVRKKVGMHNIKCSARQRFSAQAAVNALARSHCAQLLQRWRRAVISLETLCLLRGRVRMRQCHRRRATSWKLWRFQVAEGFSNAVMTRGARTYAARTRVSCICVRWKRATAIGIQWHTAKQRANVLCMRRERVLALHQWKALVARQRAIAACRAPIRAVLSRRRYFAFTRWLLSQSVSKARSCHDLASLSLSQTCWLRRWIFSAGMRRRLRGCAWMCAVRQDGRSLTASFRNWVLIARRPARVGIVGRLLLRDTYRLWCFASARKYAVRRLAHAASCHAWWTALLRAVGCWESAARLRGAFLQRTLALRRRALQWRVPRTLAQIWRTWMLQRRHRLKTERQLRRSLAHSHCRDLSGAWGSWLDLCARNVSAPERLIDATATARVILGSSLRRALPAEAAHDAHVHFHSEPKLLQATAREQLPYPPYRLDVPFCKQPPKALPPPTSEITSLSYPDSDHLLDRMVVLQQLVLPHSQPIIHARGLFLRS